MNVAASMNFWQFGEGYLTSFDLQYPDRTWVNNHCSTGIDKVSDEQLTLRRSLQEHRLKRVLLWQLRIIPVLLLFYVQDHGPQDQAVIPSLASRTLVDLNQIGTTDS